MSGRKIAMIAAAAVGLSACQIVSDPPKKVVAQDVEFLRGCWVAKAGPNGQVTRFLRLLPEGAEDADAWVAAHPERQEVRIAVGVLRDGSRDCALRLRGKEKDEDVLSGPDLVPNLARALAETLHD